MVVLPVPDGPMTMVVEQAGRPPPSMTSSCSTPVETRPCPTASASGREGRLSSASMRGYTTIPSPVILNACRPRSTALPRNLTTCSELSAAHSVSCSVSSMMPSTIVCSGVTLWPSRALLSTNTEQSVAIAVACSSCTNSLNAWSSEAARRAETIPSSTSTEACRAVISRRSSASSPLSPSSCSTCKPLK